MLMPESYAEHKEQVMAALRGLAELAGELGMRSLRVDIEAVRLPKLADERFNLVVLGEFNHGKTTFVNALLGEPLLPAGITPTTATINHIIWGETPRARAVLRDGGVLEIEPSQLDEYVTLDGSHSEQTRYVELAYPAPILRERVTLVDTPGVNDINEARAEITYSYIPRADAVVFLLDSTQPLKRSERLFIQQRLLRRSRDKLIFVLGKADLLREEELAHVEGVAGAPFRDLPTLDMLEKVHERLGYRLKLDNLAQATLGAGKSADGLMALAWWKEGRLDLITEYCRQDVAVTRDLYLHGREHGHVLFMNKAGQKVRLPVDW
jgi:GTPase SAR1 family protein